MVNLESPVGENIHAGQLHKKLRDVHQKIADEEQRLRILEKLQRGDLCTRDIMAFAQQQSYKRQINKGWDLTTSRRAMNAKIRDSKKFLTQIRNTSSQIKKQYLLVLGNKRWRLRQAMREINKHIQKSKEKKGIAYQKKFEHLQRLQEPLIKKKKNKYSFIPTKVPDRLAEYSDLPVFGTPGDMPDPEPPTGPFICSDSIKLSSQEREILSKDPKYSLMKDCDLDSFTLETERMLAKNRYNINFRRDKENKKEKVGLTIEPSVKEGAPTQLPGLKEAWSEESHRYIYDPFQKVISFVDRRPTDYKLNSRVKLPKSLHDEDEFNCETKRRLYLKTFQEYKNNSINKEKNKKKIEKTDSKQQKLSERIQNLTNNEKAGLNSILKRIKSNELMVVPTDKSGRLAILTHDQYIKSGTVHTQKDQKISWNEVKYLKNQVNAHMSWFSRILNYAKNTDPERMAGNLTVGDMDIPEMNILVKDHKSWSEKSQKPVPSRPVVSGNCCINTHLSELLSEIVEPIAMECQGSEVQSSEEVLNLIDNVNEKIISGRSIDDENILKKFMKMSSFDKRQSSAADAHDARAHNNVSLNPQDLDLFSDKLSGLVEGAPDECQSCQHNGGDPADSKLGQDLDSDDLDTVETLVSLAMNRESNLNENSQHQPSPLNHQKEGKITDHFTKISNNHNIISSEPSSVKYSNLKKISNDHYQSQKDTLNERIHSGIKAGEYWSRQLHEMNKESVKSCQSEEDACDGALVNERPPLQDVTEKPVMIGADVVGLYPNLDPVGVAHITAQSVRESTVKFSGINYLFLTIYLFLVLGHGGMIKAGLENYIPRRKQKGDSRSLSSMYNRNLENWCFDHIDYDKEDDKRNMAALMVQIMVLLMSKTTCYKFAGHIYRQRSGLGIGLRGSAALARITMCTWDKVWGTMQAALGLSIQIWCRYVDDLRFYLRPLSKGWKWVDHRWKFCSEHDDDRDPETRTANEIGKSLSSIWEFIQFTTECETEFSDLFLPTLDFSTHVEGNGYIRYKFFSKPMSSNNLLIKGTALSKSCIFSSLRQDLVRRLINTDLREGIECRVDIVKKFIQLMVNSGHKFQYVKSVVLQGISKYIYMVYRSNLNENHKLYCPLHRQRSYKNEMRKLIKYTNHARWYTDEKVGDIFKDGWKKWIKRKRYWKRKHFSKKNRSSERKPDTTTVMFVPKTTNGALMEQVQLVEDKLHHMGWKTKLVEKPGTPLFTMFSKKFNMITGCARGDRCCVCDGDGKKCCVKGVVYRAKCLECKDDIIGTYIGETSRQFGTRVQEHIANVNNLKKESFIVDHWMTKHGSEPTPPVFKFEVISKHKDALSRQLNEALHIRNQGNLNKKQEFSFNELIRLQSSKYSWEQEREQKAARDLEKHNTECLDNFINVMSVVVKSNKLKTTDTENNDANNPYCFQNLKRQVSSYWRTQRPPQKKLRRMDASTPLHYRETKLHDLSQSPIDGIVALGTGQELSTERMDEGHSESDIMSSDQTKPTGISGEVKVLEVTPPKPETLAVTVAKQSIAVNEHTDSSEHYRARLASVTAKTDDIELCPKGGNENEVHDQYALADIPWEDHEKFKAYDSDSKSLEVSDLLALDDERKSEHLNHGSGAIVMSDKNNLNQNVVEVGNKSGKLTSDCISFRESGAIVKFDKNNLNQNVAEVGAIVKLDKNNLNQDVAEVGNKSDKLTSDCIQFPTGAGGSNKKNLCDENNLNQQMVDEVANIPTLGEEQHMPDLFGENHLDPEEVGAIIEEKMKNKLFGIFSANNKKVKTEAGRMISGVKTPTKRKLSPESQQATPSPKLNRLGENVGASPNLRQPATPARPGRRPSLGSVSRVKRSERKRTFSLGANQQLITTMMKAMNKRENGKEMEEKLG